MSPPPLRPPLRIVNVPDISPADDPFVDLGAHEWVRLSGLPANALERAVRRPRVARYRAALQAALAARGRAIVVSHLPLMSAAVARALPLLGRRAPHLAFSFNFTRLPDGVRRAALARAFARIDRFAIYSRYEQALYADWFGIAPDRLRPVIWTQDVPEIAAVPLPIAAPYVCAIGGEGRDFATLLAALATRPAGLGAVVIARPHSLIGMTIPENVRIFTDLGPPETWAIAAGSVGVLVPLLSEETCCGQVTLVGAKLLGLPLVTSRAHATEDYVAGRPAVLVTPPRDVPALRAAIERLADEQASLRAAARDAIPAERAIHDRAHWADYLAAFIKDHDRGLPPIRVG